MKKKIYQNPVFKIAEQAKPNSIFFAGSAPEPTKNFSLNNYKKDNFAW